MVKSEGHLRGGISGKDVKDASVEHASVEVDLSVPALEAGLPLLVNKSRVLLVVGSDDVQPVLLLEEGVPALVEGLEVGGGLIASLKRFAPVGLGRAHLLGGSLVVTERAEVVPLEGSVELMVDLCDLL